MSSLAIHKLGPFRLSLLDSERSSGNRPLLSKLAMAFNNAQIRHFLEQCYPNHIAILSTLRVTEKADFNATDDLEYIVNFESEEVGSLIVEILMYRLRDNAKSVVEATARMRLFKFTSVED